MRGLRSRNGWTLKEMSQHSGIPISTLSKVEHDRLTLTYDKLQQLSARLNIRMSDLFAEGETAPAAGAVPTGRRSIGTLAQSVHVNTQNYDYYYLCTELRHKRMIPSVTRIRAKSLEEFGELVRHPGEEFIYVVEGRIIVHSEFYDPVILNVGEFIYIDSSMGHAYLAGEGCDEAVVMAVMSSADEDLMAELINLHGERVQEVESATAPAARRRAAKKPERKVA
ncbi:helix-turn-helix domain-containing protein [Sphingomonas quercus]|nr:XRE family transcriptional regulator [Sphingomonas quercus]